MAAAFPRVLRDPIEPTNTLLVGGGGEISAARLESDRARCRRTCGGWPARAAARLAPRLPGGEVYTDDHAPVEWLIDELAAGIRG